MQWFSVDLHLHHKSIIFLSTKEQQGREPGPLAGLVWVVSHIAPTSEALGSRQGCLSLTFKSAKRFSLLSVEGDQMQFKKVCFC